MRGGTLERCRARVDALLATSPAAAAQAAEFYPGDYTVIPDGIASAFAPGPEDGTRIVVEWCPRAAPSSGPWSSWWPRRPEAS